MIGILFASVLSIHRAPDMADDPAFQALKVLVGGTWEGRVGKDVKVQFRFTLEQGGKMIVANGIVGAGTPTAMHARSSIGWDPEAKQLYYLDQHGYDTVYFGHVTKKGDELLWDFKGLSGDTGHYLSTERISETEYSSTMSVEKDGKWKDMGFHLALHRSKTR